MIFWHVCLYYTSILSLHQTHGSIESFRDLFDQKIILSINIPQSICKIFCHHTAAAGTYHHLNPAAIETSPQGG